MTNANIQSEIPTLLDSAAEKEETAHLIAETTPPSRQTHLQKRADLSMRLVERLSRSAYYGSIQGREVRVHRPETPLHCINLGNGVGLVSVRLEHGDIDEDNITDVGILLNLTTAVYLRNTLEDFIWAELNREGDDE